MGEQILKDRSWKQVHQRLSPNSMPIKTKQESELAVYHSWDTEKLSFTIKIEKCRYIWRWFEQGREMKPLHKHFKVLRPSSHTLWLSYVSIIFFTQGKHFPLNCSTGPHRKRWYLFNFAIKSSMIFFWYLKSFWRSDPTFTEDFSYLWGTQPSSPTFNWSD